MPGPGTSVFPKLTLLDNVHVHVTAGVSVIIENKTFPIGNCPHDRVPITIA